MPDQTVFLKGVIEGFYGRAWSFETRCAYAGYLPLLGLDTYLYCPKADPYLRKSWHQPWPEPQFQQLRELSRIYKERSLYFGVGLSPFALYENYGGAQRHLLEQKIQELNRLEAPILAILFDDMPGELPDLASRQGDIVKDIVSWTRASRVLVCPTYYSFDPVLEKYFGAMPSGYWHQLGKVLPENIDILWTGREVCSQSVTVDDIEAAQAQLGRRIVLWDNYPVNDGAVRSKFLYTEKLYARETGLAGVLGGHLCNPMNQGLLSLRALTGLGDLYRGDSGEKEWLKQIWGEEVFDRLTQDMGEFQALGLEGIGSKRRQDLAALYSRLPGEAAREVAGWLRGEFAFDPACLTD